MLGRQKLRVNGGEIPGNAGYRALSGVRRYADATAGNIMIPAAAFLAGWLDRSGPGAGYGDTTPSADALLAALPDLMRGDSFEMMITSSVAFANTLVAGAGITFAGTSGVAASSTRSYLITLTSEPKRTRVCVGSTTNANAILTNLSITDLSNIGVGMGVSGTNIAAATTVLAVNLSALTVTMSANATGSGDNIALTFTPQFEMRGISTAGN